MLFTVTTQPSTVKTYESNTSEENRIKYVTDLAAIARGNYYSKNPSIRYKQLLKEAKGNIIGEKKKQASRPLEFLPVRLNATIDSTDEYNRGIRLTSLKGDFVGHVNFDVYFNDILPFSYTVHKNSTGGVINQELFTNMRALVNAGIYYDLIPYNTSDELRMFAAIRVKSPMFAWAHLVTHGRLSKESQSDRHSDAREFWLPEDIFDRMFETGEDLLADYNYNDDNKFEILKTILSKMPQDDVIEFFIILGYEREIYSRAIYYFKYKEMVMTGWVNDPKTWSHFFLERDAIADDRNKATQTETAKVVSGIKIALEDYLNIPFS